jgi:hypothetical protein
MIVDFIKGHLAKKKGLEKETVMSSTSTVFTKNEICYLVHVSKSVKTYFPILEYRKTVARFREVKLKVVARITTLEINASSQCYWKNVELFA